MRAPLVRAVLAGVLGVHALVASATAHAGSSNPTTTTNLLRANGSGEVVASGDWVTDRPAPALDNAYRFFIEVPPGLPQLVVEVFDPDVGRGGNNEGTRDLLTGGAFNTAVIYTLFNPAGAQVGPTITCSSAATPAVCVDNAWSALFGTVTNPPAGHWQLVVDPSDANGQNGDETMGYGVRAHDGNAGAGGVELNVYADSYIGLGPTTATDQSNTIFPWVTAGCFARSNDFDADGATPGTSYALTGNVGFSQTFTTVSANSAWLVNATGNFTNDNTAQNYGVWTDVVTVHKGAGAAANMITYYVSSPFSATAGTGTNPHTQPGEPGAFRLYMPTDAGGAPVKPFVEQFVRALGGPNPPQAGQTTVLSVTVAVRNPTSAAITFNASHVVTATVPGGTVSYTANSAAVSQGAIVSQPAGGTGGGNVVWNPGVIAAGGDAIVTYVVTVTPASAGQRILVTGAAGTGTTAVYVDETANATQARASYTFGPLCELAVTVGLVTYASIVDVTGTRAGGDVRLAWRSVGEAGTIGYSVERVALDGNRVPVGGLVLASMNGAGGSYSIVDDGAGDVDDADVFYAIVEHDARGGVHDNGPFAAFPAPSLDVATGAAAIRARGAIGAGATAADAIGAGASGAGATGVYGPHVPRGGAVPGAIAGGPASASSAAASTEAVLASAGPSQRLRMFVDDAGLAGVRLSDVAAVLQQPASVVEAAAEAHTIAIEHDGVHVAWDLVGDGALREIVFAGAVATRPYGAEGVFYLSLQQIAGTAEPRATIANGDPGARGPVHFAAQSDEHFEEDQFPAPVVDLDPFSDLWFWTAFLAGDPTLDTFSTTLPVSDDAAGPAFITVALQGATVSGIPREHRANVVVDGVRAGTLVFSGLARAVATFPLPAPVSGGSVDVAIDAIDTGVPDFNVFYLDSISIAHQRTLDAAQPFSFPANAGDGIAIAGLAADGLVYVAGDDGSLVKVAGGRAVAGALRVRLPAAGRVLFARTPQTASASGTPRAPLRMESVTAPGDLEVVDSDVVIITAHPLARGAAELVALHGEQGLTDRVVFVDDLFDRYAFGARDPRAIPRYLAALREHSPSPPRFVVLLGDGSIDYRDVLGLHDNFVPPMLARTENGVVAADALSVDVDGDAVPDFAFGRIPARNTADIEHAIARMRAFTGPSNALVVADNAETNADFPGTAAGIAQQLALPARTLVLGDGAAALAPARQALFAGLDGFDQGGLLIYVGHGGLDRLTEEGLLTSADAVDVGRRGPAAIIALTCFINRFELPGFDGFGEVFARDGGAPIVIAPAGVGVHAQADELSQHLASELRRGGPIGEMLFRAEHSYVDAGGDRQMTTVENLLGDPTLSFAAEPGDAPSCGAGNHASLAVFALLVLALRSFVRGRRR